jgi:virginiamycin A acetyltransferase
MDEKMRYFTKLVRKLSKKKIILIGAENIVDIAVTLLESLNFKIEYYVDILEEKTRLNYVKKEVIETLLCEDKDKIALLVTSVYSYQKISRKLVQLGFLEGIHFWNELSLLTTNFNFTVGRHSYGYENFFKHGNRISSIGAFCSIAYNVYAADGNHPTDFISTHPFFYDKDWGFIDEDRTELLNKKNDRIVIGNDVWIGCNVTILPSVKIGNGIIVGAGSLINKDIPDYAVVAGVPAKIIRYRFEPEIITKLNEIKWWDWSDEKIKENIDYFKDNIGFIKSFE